MGHFVNAGECKFKNKDGTYVNANKDIAMAAGAKNEDPGRATTSKRNETQLQIDNTTS